jgi:hypothetical protein
MKEVRRVRILNFNLLISDFLIDGAKVGKFSGFAYLCCVEKMVLPFYK